MPKYFNMFAKGYVTFNLNNYAQWRANPPHYHAGVDMGVKGSDIRSATDGVVTVNRYSDSAGNVIEIRAPDGWYYTYMHMASRSSCKVGSSVSAGQHIGTMGNTGRSKGAHLHFQISRNSANTTGRWGFSGTTDPVKFFNNLFKNSLNEFVEGIGVGLIGEGADGSDGYLMLNPIGSTTKLKLDYLKITQSTGHSLRFEGKLIGDPLTLGEGDTTDDNGDVVSVEEQIILSLGGKMGDKPLYQFDITKQIEDSVKKNKSFAIFEFIISNLKGKDLNYEFSQPYLYISWYESKTSSEPVATFPDAEYTDASQATKEGGNSNITVYGYLHPNDEISEDSSYNKDKNRGYIGFRDIVPKKIIGTRSLKNNTVEFIGEVTVEKIDNLIEYCSNYNRWHHQKSALEKIDKESILFKYKTLCSVAMGEPISANKYNNFIDMILDANENCSKKFEEYEYFNVKKVSPKQLITADLFSINLSKNGLPNCDPNEKDKTLWNNVHIDSSKIKKVEKGTGITNSAGNFSYKENGEVQKTVWFTLRSVYSDYVTAGIMANIKRESGFNYKVMNDYKGLGHKGLCQWDKSRWANGKAQGYDMMTLKGQLGFLVWELEKGNNWLGKNLPLRCNVSYGAWKRLTDAVLAGEIFMRRFERGSNKEMAAAMKILPKDALGFLSKGREWEQERVKADAEIKEKEEEEKKGDS